MGKLLGVVMCGGESRRMGTDKGLIPQGNQAWAQLCHAKLSGLNIPVAVSVNQSQIGNYQAIFKVDDMIVDAQQIPGPLNGILSVHVKHPDSDILILACDMIAMDSSTLLQLVNAYQSQPGHDFYAYHNGAFFEPLCAIYTAKALSTLKLKFDDAELGNYSLQQVLKSGTTMQLQILDISRFKNQNDKAV
jgi:molybdopterin-guanine dinucleotide biosynthesis protein A